MKSAITNSKIQVFDKPVTVYSGMAISILSGTIVAEIGLISTGDPFAIPSIYIFGCGGMLLLLPFVLSAFISFTRPKVAATISTISSLVLWVILFLWFNLIVNNESFLSFLLSLIKPPTTFILTLPLICLAVTTNYAVWSLQANSDPSPLQWLKSSKHGQWIRWFLILVLVLIPIVIVINVFFRFQTKLITHEVKWTKSYYSRTLCPEGYVDGLSLEFVESPGYTIEICTTGALNYLETSKTSTVPAKFIAHYDLFDFDYYEVIQIGDWIGQGVRREGSLTCIHYDKGSQCGGVEVRNKTKELFSYNRP